jgi:hypothetical protein
MREVQTMRLGIPGSTASVFPDRVSCRWKNTWEEAVTVNVALAAGSIALATLHMVQHFMQP